MEFLEHKNSCCGRGLVKGSQEAKDWAKKMAEARKKKKAITKETEPKVKIEMMGETQLVLPGRPSKYTSQEEAKKAKAQQDKERYNKKKQNKTETTGEGIMKKIGNIVQTTKRKIDNTTNRIETTAKEVIFGATDLPRSVKDILNKYGNERITSLTLMRTPVPKVLTGALSLFSAGKFGKNMEKNHFDTLFHLFLEVGLESGKKIQLEKNERINMIVNPASRPHTETKTISGGSVRKPDKPEDKVETIKQRQRRLEREERMRQQEEELRIAREEERRIAREIERLIEMMREDDMADSTDEDEPAAPTGQGFSTTGLTLNTMMTNTEREMGEKKFLGYSAKNNNCQDFLVSVLKSNNLGNADDIAFIKQDTKELFEGLPYLRKLSNTLTTIGAKADVLKSGGAIGCGVKKSSSWIDHIRKFAKDNDMTYSCALSDPRCSKEYREKKNKPTMTLKEINDNRKIASKQAKEYTGKINKRVKKIINSQTEPDEVEEDYDVVSNKLQQMLYLTKPDDLVKVLKSLNFKGKLPTQKVLQVMTILQNFKTIPQMKGLMSKIKEAENKEPSFNPLYKKSAGVVL